MERMTSKPLIKTWAWRRFFDHLELGVWWLLLWNYLPSFFTQKTENEQWNSSRIILLRPKFTIVIAVITLLCKNYWQIRAKYGIVDRRKVEPQVILLSLTNMRWPRRISILFRFVTLGKRRAFFAKGSHKWGRHLSWPIAPELDSHAGMGTVKPQAVALSGKAVYCSWNGGQRIFENGEE